MKADVFYSLTIFSLVRMVLSNAQHPLSTSEVGSVKDPYQFPTSEHYIFPSAINSVAVIGAGPSGLQHAATLLKYGFRVRLFERDVVPGGNWRYTDETPLDVDYPDKPLPMAAYTPDIPSVLPFSKTFTDGDEGVSLSDRYREHWLPRPVWNTMKSITASVITSLPNIKYEEGSPWAISQQQLQRNVRQYASAHGLSPIDSEYPNTTSYGTRVERLRKIHPTNSIEDSKWQLTLRKFTPIANDSGGLSKIIANWWTEEFDAVVVATGAQDSAHVPEIKGLHEIARNTKQVYHSRNYRHPHNASGKSVLIVGSSFSSSGIARDIINHAKLVTVSARQHSGPLNPVKAWPLSLIPHNASIVPEIAEFKSLDEIHLINGTVLTGIDEVILATGFRRSNPFLSDYHNATLSRQPHDFDVAPILKEGIGLYSVAFSGHYIDDPTLAFATVRAWTLGALQGLGFAKVWKGTARLPTRQALWDEYYSQGGQPIQHDSALWGTPLTEVLNRRFVTWLNNESYLHGGKLPNSYPIKDREIFLNYMAANGFPVPGTQLKESFEHTDNTPAQEYIHSIEEYNSTAWDQVVWNINW
ncbi:FAD/NAD(P)-binding domain-containing protein [Ramaria rubella]|nr:FAD/NAD(P)-binding domain-containing protein [Ramaria rubella]